MQKVKAEKEKEDTTTTTTTTTKVKSLHVNLFWTCEWCVFRQAYFWAWATLKDVSFFPVLFVFYFGEAETGAHK